jgi:hypothetical protein
MRFRFAGVLTTESLDLTLSAGGVESSSSLRGESSPSSAIASRSLVFWAAS